MAKEDMCKQETITGFLNFNCSSYGIINSTALHLELFLFVVFDKKTQFLLCIVGLGSCPSGIQFLPGSLSF